MIKEYLKKLRKYASFRSSTRDLKSISELDAVRDLLSSMMQVYGYCYYKNPKANPEDPPDCFVDDKYGNLIGVEVTEFVSQEAIARNEKEDASYYKEWDDKEIIQKFKSIIIKKDGKTYKKETCNFLVLLIHTDEPALTFERIEKLLKDQKFKVPTQFKEAYLLFSYDPRSHHSNTSAYPFIKLKFTDDL